MIDTQFIEKIKVLQTAYQKEKSLRLSLEEKLRRLSENNSHLTTELREKEKSCLDLQKESLSLNNLLFEGKADIKENLRIKLQEIGIDDSPETSEFFNKIRDLLGFTQEKKKLEILEEIKQILGKNQSYQQEIHVLLEKLRKLELFSSLHTKYSEILDIYTEFDKLNIEIQTLSTELQAKDQDFLNFSEKRKSIENELKDSETRNVELHQKLDFLEKDLEKIKNDKFEMSSILQKEMLINSQISQDLNYAQEKIQENREIIAKLEEKMKDFNKIYQSYEAKYIGSASSELSSSILIILRKNINKEYVIEYEFKTQNFVRKIKEISDIRVDQDGRNLSLIYQTEGGFKEFEHLESKDSLGICKSIQELIDLSKPPPIVQANNKEIQKKNANPGLFNGFKSYFG